MKVDKEILLCVIKDFSWKNFKKCILTKRVDEHSLEVQIELAKKAWLIAQNQLEWADRDMLEAAILQTTACERKYMALLKKARSEQYQTWDTKELTPVVAGNC
ncbi:hypothetical protein JCM14036_10220 [Desulfotomaculum defluvii]